jgi:hypothetical protein
MIFRHLWWYVVTMRVMLVPLWNRNLPFLTGLGLGIAQVAVLARLALRWTLESTRWRIIAISATGGFLAGITTGVLIGWGGGPSGSPTAQFFGRQVHYSVVGFPIVFGAVSSNSA